jgi:PAS domain S-box-containing protein
MTTNHTVTLPNGNAARANWHRSSTYSINRGLHMQENDSNTDPFSTDPAEMAQRKMRWFLHENEALFLQIWDSVSDAMALSDAEGIVLATNPAYLRLYGYKLEEVIGKSFAIIFPEASREWAVEEYKVVFSSEVTPAAYETIVRRADGTERIVEATPSFLTVAGKRTMMLSMIRDITQQKQQEQELRRLKEMLAKNQHDGNI